MIFTSHHLFPPWFMSCPVSVFIITKNEEERITRAISSVIAWVDEVIVVDSGSTDDTVKIAQAIGAKVVFNAWPGYGAQKRFGEDLCRNAWILNIDADEEVTKELESEIKQLFFHGNPKYSAYMMAMRDVLPGQQREMSINYSKWAIRLYNKTKARFSESPVHDSVIVEHGAVGRLRSPCLHYSFRNITHAIEKMNSYTSAQARDMLTRGVQVNTLRLVLEFPATFFKAYFLRRFVVLGRQGFVYAMIYAFTRTMRLAKYNELLRDTEKDQKH